MAKILQVNYTLEGSAAEFMAGCVPLAPVLADVPGLRWKVWLANEAEHEGGGIYLFEDNRALEAFMNGPIIERLRAHPAVRSVSLKPFDVQDALSRVTRGPVERESQHA